ncbi:hypothetical protein BC567DRAFT_252042 [Phyllosticta citribraziliensis]
MAQAVALLAVAVASSYESVSTWSPYCARSILQTIGVQPHFLLYFHTFVPLGRVSPSSSWRPAEYCVESSYDGEHYEAGCAGSKKTTPRERFLVCQCSERTQPATPAASGAGISRV